MKNKIVHSFYWFVIKTSRNNKLTRVFIDLLALYYYKLFRSAYNFKFNGQKYKYFYHLYNRTVAGERVVEIPIGKVVLEEFRVKDKNILEVGNVFAHYFKIEHDVLDKYEKGKAVINQDVIHFKPKKRYDLIISISTMEHVGWSYGEKRDSGKFLKGVLNLQKYLSPKGKMLVTFPVDYREDLHSLILKNKMPFNKEYFMKRISFWNEWKQVSKKEALSGVKYDAYYANANAIYIGILDRE